MVWVTCLLMHLNTFNSARPQHLVNFPAIASYLTFRYHSLFPLPFEASCLPHRLRILSWAHACLSRGGTLAAASTWSHLSQQRAMSGSLLHASATCQPAACPPLLPCSQRCKREQRPCYPSQGMPYSCQTPARAFRSLNLPKSSSSWRGWKWMSPICYAMGWVLHRRIYLNILTSR